MCQVHLPTEERILIFRYSEKFINILRQLKDLSEDYHCCYMICILMGETAYPPALFAEQLTCIEGVMQTTLFCA